MLTVEEEQWKSVDVRQNACVTETGVTADPVHHTAVMYGLETAAQTKRVEDAKTSH